jgi:hypothetical protein
MRSTTAALGALLIGSTFVMAAGFQGVVTGVDSKGMATVRASDNKEHQVKIGDGLRLNDMKVQCETKNNALECRPAQTQAAMTPAPSTAGAAAARPTTPAPANATSAPSSSTSAPASSAPAPSPTAPTTGSK